MKSILFLLCLMGLSNAYATIQGPACGDLTSVQKRLLKRAAKDYVAKRPTGPGVTLDLKSLEASDSDCHDYDGVHSSSEISVEWDQVDEDQDAGCSQMIGVSVEYDSATKRLVIDKNSQFKIEELGAIECEN